MKKALIVIDLQKGFITKHTKDLPLKIQRYIEKNKGKYDLILFTQYRNHPKSNFVKYLNYRGFMSKDRYDIVEQLKQFVHKDNLFPKDTYGSFVNGRLPAILKKNKIEEVHIAGIDTEHLCTYFCERYF